MALSWNEIKDRAVAFSKEWEDTFNEEAETKPGDFIRSGNARVKRIIQNGATFII